MARKVTAHKKQLAWGELTTIASTLGKSVSHVARVIAGKRKSEELAARIKALTGYDIADLDLPTAA